MVVSWSLVAFLCCGANYNESKIQNDKALLHSHLKVMCPV